MNANIPVGLPVPLLAFPPAALCGSIFLLIASGWGTSASSWAPMVAFVGGLGLLLSLFAAFVLVPVGIYTLVKNPALRTAKQFLAIGGASLVLALPVLAIFGGGI